MSELVIFQTEHAKQDPRILYPSDRNVSDRAIEECHNWFDDRRARVVNDTQRIVIESFVALRTDRGKRSAYVRYEADGVEGSFPAFRRRLSEVIEKEGWELLEQDPSPRDDTWLFEQIMHSNLEEKSPQALEFQDSEDAQALGAILNGEHNAVVAVRTYQHAMDALLAFMREGRSIVIYHRKPAGRTTVEADLDLVVQPDKSQAYVLSTETREAVEEYKNREQRHIDDLQAAIRGLAAHEVTPTRVVEHVDEQLDENYPHNTSRFGAYLKFGLRGMSHSPSSQETTRERINTYLDQCFDEFKIPSPEAWKQLKTTSGDNRSSGRHDTRSSGTQTSERTRRSGRGASGRDTNKRSGSGSYDPYDGVAKRLSRKGGRRRRKIILTIIAIVAVLTLVALALLLYGVPELLGGGSIPSILSGGSADTGATQNATAATNYSGY